MITIAFALRRRERRHRMARADRRRRTGSWACRRCRCGGPRSMRARWPRPSRWSPPPASRSSGCRRERLGRRDARGARRGDRGRRPRPRPGRDRWTAFVVSAAYAGVAGGLFAPLTGFVTPADVPLHHVDPVRAGGDDRRRPATVTGPLVGAVIVVLLPEVLSSLAEYRLLVFGALLLRRAPGSRPTAWSARSPRASAGGRPTPARRPRRRRRPPRAAAGRRGAPISWSRASRAPSAACARCPASASPRGAARSPA